MPTSAASRAQSQPERCGGAQVSLGWHTCYAWPRWLGSLCPWLQPYCTECGLLVRQQGPGACG